MKTKKPIHKVDSVIALCKRKAGTTIPDIAKKLSVSKIAAASLIGDARRKGERVKCKMDADGVGRYYV
jgi:hypothetical protein